MGRRRTKSPHWLPKRVYPHGAQLLYRPRIGKPIPLGPISDVSACLAKYGRLVGEQPTPRTVTDVLDRYLTEIVPTKKPRTQEHYRTYVANLRRAFGHMSPEEISKADLYAYHEARKAPVRANREISTFGQIFRHAIRWRAATVNPVEGFLYAEEHPRTREVTLTELRRFNRMVPRWLRVYCLLKLLTGLRQSDLLQLGQMNVDELRGLLRVNVGKTRGNKVKVMEFRLTWALRAVLRAAAALPRPKTQTLFFISQRGKTRGQALSQRGFKSAWQRAQMAWAAAGGAPFVEHDLRASAAQEASKRAADLLGHDSDRPTKKHYLRGARRVTPLR
jgi:integrase